MAVYVSMNYPGPGKVDSSDNVDHSLMVKAGCVAVLAFYIAYSIGQVLPSERVRPQPKASKPVDGR